jgi:hypothetical protein
MNLSIINCPAGNAVNERSRQDLYLNNQCSKATGSRKINTIHDQLCHPQKCRKMSSVKRKLLTHRAFTDKHPACIHRNVFGISCQDCVNTVTVNHITESRNWKQKDMSIC